MAPRKKGTPNVSTAEAAMAAPAPSMLRAKRSRTSIAAAEEETNNSMHREIVGSDKRTSRASLSEDWQMRLPPAVASEVSREAYKALQRELANLCQEMMGLR